MSRDDEQCLKLGREVVRMIRDMATVANRDAAYARRTLTFPGGEVHLLLANSASVADLMEAGVVNGFDVESATPPSQQN